MGISKADYQANGAVRDWQLICHQGSDALDTIRHSWQALEARAARAFYHRWHWHEALSQILCPEQVPLYVEIKDSSDTVAILPLQRGRFGPLSVASNLIHEHASLHDWLIAPEISQRQIIEFFNAHPEQWSHLGVQRLSLYHTLAPAFDEAPPHSQWRTVQQSAYFPTRGVSLNEVVSGKMRRNLRSKSKKFGKDLRFVQITDGEALVGAFETFIAIEASGWKRQEGSAIALSEPLKHFYLTLLQTFSHSNEAAINLLYAEDQCLAAQLALRTGKRWSILKIGYSETHADLSPGALLLLSVLEHAIEDADCDELSLTTAPEWCRRWHPQFHDVGHLHLYRPSLCGRALHALENLKHARRS